MGLNFFNFWKKNIPIKKTRFFCCLCYPQATHGFPQIIQPIRSSRWASYNKHIYKYINILAWEPSAAKVTKSYSSRLPALERFYRETKFTLLKSIHSTKNLKTKLRTFQWVSRVPQSKCEANRSRGSWIMIGQTNRQTEITTLYR